MRFKYSAYGLTIETPFPCPGLAVEPDGSVTDLLVEEGTVPKTLLAPQISGARWEAQPGRFLLRGGRRAGRFLVEKGGVTLQRNPEAEDTVLGAAFVSVVLRAALVQRGQLVLHANALGLEREAIVIAGASGAGKSTTLAALIEAGGRMLADDVTVVRRGLQDNLEVVPGGGELRLSRMTAERLGFPAPDDRLASWGAPKASVSPRTQFDTSPMRLARIYVLSMHSGQDLAVTELSGTEKFDALLDCLYGPLFATEHDAVFPICAAILDQVALIRIKRPSTRWSVPEVSEIVLTDTVEARR